MLNTSNWVLFGYLTLFGSMYLSDGRYRTKVTRFVTMFVTCTRIRTNFKMFEINLCYMRNLNKGADQPEHPRRLISAIDFRSLQSSKVY